MLTTTRKTGESLYLTLSDDIDANTPIGEILSEPIEIYVHKTKRVEAILCVHAPKEIKILRNELA